MNIFELSVYSPAVEEIWKETGIWSLKTERAIDGNWSAKCSRHWSTRP